MFKGKKLNNIWCGVTSDAGKICQARKTQARQQRGRGEGKVNYSLREEEVEEEVKEHEKTETTEHRPSCCVSVATVQPTTETPIRQNCRQPQGSAERCWSFRLNFGSMQFLGNCLGNKVAESLHQSAVSQVTSQRTNRDRPSLPLDPLLSQGPHRFVCFVVFYWGFF